MVRKLLTLLGVIALGAHLFAGTAEANKGCRKLCKDIRLSCIADANLFYPCKTVPKTDKKTCRKGLKAAKAACRHAFVTTLAHCKASTTETTCSPSGAFIGVD